MTVKEQITKWAKANYNNSYAAQCVVEGCYDDCDFAEYRSLKDFLKSADGLDDRYADIRAEVF